MYEQDGKNYVIKLNDFAAENGVSLRTVQKKLITERYRNALEGEFIRTSSNGTWITENAATFLKTTLKSKAVGYISTEHYEQELEEARIKIEKLQDTLLDIQQRYIELTEENANLKIEMSKTALLEAENCDLRALNDKKGKELNKVENELKTANLELSAIKNKWWYKLTHKQK